jgi:hypothetical protein
MNTIEHLEIILGLVKSDAPKETIVNAISAALSDAKTYASAQADKLKLAEENAERDRKPGIRITPVRFS